MKAEKPLPDTACSFNRFVLHHNAVNRAWRNTEFTAGAFVCDHGVHLFHRAKDGIDRAGLDAQGAAYACLLINDCNSSRFFYSIFGVQGQGLPPQQASQGTDSSFAARRALVDFSLAGCDCFGVRATPLEITFPALGLRKQSVNAIRQLVPWGTPVPRSPSAARSVACYYQADGKNCKDHQPGLVTGGASTVLIRMNR
jgi:hypothetical protein